MKKLRIASQFFALASLVLWGTTALSETIVPMISEGGTFRVPVTINDELTLKFVIDSGAADVSVPADVVMTLVRTGTITDTDFLGKQTYKLADGSTVPSQQFVIRSLKVGDKREGGGGRRGGEGGETGKGGGGDGKGGERRKRASRGEREGGGGRGRQGWRRGRGGAQQRARGGRERGGGGARESWGGGGTGEGDWEGGRERKRASENAEATRAMRWSAPRCCAWARERVMWRRGEMAHCLAVCDAMWAAAWRRDWLVPHVGCGVGLEVAGARGWGVAGWGLTHQLMVRRRERQRRHRPRKDGVVRELLMVGGRGGGGEGLAVGEDAGGGGGGVGGALGWWEGGKAGGGQRGKVRVPGTACRRVGDGNGWGRGGGGSGGEGGGAGSGTKGRGVARWAGEGTQKAPQLEGVCGVAIGGDGGGGAE